MMETTSVTKFYRHVQIVNNSRRVEIPLDMADAFHSTW